MDKNRKHLITIGHWEGISYLVLLGIAMPLKYMFDMPLPVRWVGSAHGVLFVSFSLILLKAYLRMPLSFKLAAFIFFLSFVPFGTFFIKRFLPPASKVDYLNI